MDGPSLLRGPWICLLVCGILTLSERLKVIRSNYVESVGYPGSRRHLPTKAGRGGSSLLHKRTSHHNACPSHLIEQTFHGHLHRLPTHRSRRTLLRMIFLRSGTSKSAACCSCKFRASRFSGFVVAIGDLHLIQHRATQSNVSCSLGVRSGGRFMCLRFIVGRQMSSAACGGRGCGGWRI